MRLLIAFLFAGGLAWPAHAALILPGNTTDVTLTSAPVLGSLGVTVTPLGSATIATGGPFPVASFPITGGSATGSALLIEHDGSGLALSAGATSLTIGNFLIDTSAAIVFADVEVNGSAFANDFALFSIAPGLELLLTGGAAGALNTVFGVTAFTEGLSIGTASTAPIIAVPAPAAAAMLLVGLTGLAGVARRKRIPLMAGMP